MKLLKSVWAEMTVAGNFKGSLEDFAIKNFEHGNALFNGNQKISSLLEIMGSDSSRWYVDEKTMTCCGSKIAATFKPDPEWPKKEKFEHRYKELKSLTSKELLEFIQSHNRLDASHMKSEPKESLIYWICEHEGLLKPKPKKSKASEEASNVAIVTYVDRDYKTKTKKFINDPAGAPENAMIKARNFARKLESQEDIRSVNVKWASVFSASEEFKCSGCSKSFPAEKLTACGDKKFCASCAKSRMARTAKLAPKADLPFGLMSPTLNCPHCNLPMKPATLANNIASLMCPNCRHVDYDEKVKSTVNAGSPSVDKILQFKCLDSGNCQIV